MIHVSPSEMGVEGSLLMTDHVESKNSSLLWIIEDDGDEILGLSVSVKTGGNDCGENKGGVPRF